MLRSLKDHVMAFDRPVERRCGQNCANRTVKINKLYAKDTQYVKEEGRLAKIFEIIEDD